VPSVPVRGAGTDQIAVLNYRPRDRRSVARLQNGPVLSRGTVTANSQRPTRRESTKVVRIGRCELARSRSVDQIDAVCFSRTQSIRRARPPVRPPIVAAVLARPGARLRSISEDELVLGDGRRITGVGSDSGA